MQIFWSHEDSGPKREIDCLLTQWEEFFSQSTISRNCLASTFTPMFLLSLHLFFCVFTEMSDEQSVAVVWKRKAEAVCCNQLACIVHYDQHEQHTTKEVRPLSGAQFQSICYARDTRRDQISDTVRLDRICENIPESFNSQVHGSHRWCFKN